MHETRNIRFSRQYQHPAGTCIQTVYKMNFAGFKKAKDRANIIMFLHGKADTPMALPK